MSPSVSAPLSSSSTQQKFVKEDYERHFFAKFLEERDDDPPVVEREDTIIGNNSSAQTSDCMIQICACTGRIFPATARKPVGLLPMHSTSAGDQDLARRGHLQRRGTTFPGGTSAF